MSGPDQYILIHITTEGEYQTPLVASQLFDQAQTQAVERQGNAPLKVEAWVIGVMREYFDKKAKARILSLKKRCPNVTIRMINGIGRLKKFPIFELMVYFRNKMGRKVPVIYHCRGEIAAGWALKLKNAFPEDRVVLDVRGYWPAEAIYRYGVEDPSQATGKYLEEYNQYYQLLKSAIAKVDAVTTVSKALKRLLIDEMNAPDDTSVVPCCVTHITTDDRRNEIREQLGIKPNEIVLVYSGTTAAYQHLDDLTIPFLKILSSKNKNLRLAFFSSEVDKIRELLRKAGMDRNDIIVKGLAQKEVTETLTACDVGILIRKPTLVNRVANPVKIAEYMSSGLPMIIEKGVGGVDDILFEQGLLKGIEIADPSADMDKAANEVNEWLQTGMAAKRQQIREYVREVYLWSSAINVSRKMYMAALETKKK